MLMMICRELDVGGKHSGTIRADLAERELDALIGSISLEDPALIRQIEEELAGLVREVATRRRNSLPDGARTYPLLSKTQISRRLPVANLRRWNSGTK
jgi:hypothetical protein